MSISDATDFCVYVDGDNEEWEGAGWRPWLQHLNATCGQESASVLKSNLQLCTRVHFPRFMTFVVTVLLAKGNDAFKRREYKTAHTLCKSALMEMLRWSLIVLAIEICERGTQLFEQIRER